MRPKTKEKLGMPLTKRPGPRRSGDADMGVEEARPAPPGAPRKLEDIDVKWRKPLVPPPLRRADMLDLELVPAILRRASAIGEALPERYRIDQGPDAGTTVNMSEVCALTAAGVRSGWGTGALERREALEV